MSVLLTHIVMKQGVYQAKLIAVPEDDRVIADRALWEELIEPGLTWLRAQGGGEMIITHPPGDQARFM